MEQQEDIQGLLTSILRAIVVRPEEVQVIRSVDERGVLISVKLGEGDAGRVIGKEGRTVQAIRTLMAAIGANQHARINVKLDVPDRKPVPDRFVRSRRETTDVDPELGV